MKKYKIAILGLGTAGVFAARALKKKGFNDFVVIGKIDGNSFFSPWNMRIEEGGGLYKKLIKNLDGSENPERMKLLKYLAENHVRVFLDLLRDEWKDIEFLKTTFGFRPKAFKPGRILLDKISKRYIKNQIENEIVDIEKIEIGYILRMKNNEVVLAENIIVGVGGQGRIKKNTTGEKRQITNLVEKLRKLGAKWENKGYMRHPFLIKDKDIPNALVSGYFIVRANFYLEDFKTKEKKEFLSKDIKTAIANDDYHHLFPEIEKEFSEASKKGRVLMESKLSKEEYDDFVKNNEFGDVFVNKPYGDWLKEIEIIVGEHYTIGGLQVNSKLEIQGLKNAYALGEVVSLYGGRRMGGMGHIDSMVLSEILADSFLQ